MTRFDHRLGEEAAFVDGLVVAEGKSYSNWGGHRATRPAVYVEPVRYADVQAVVRDAARFRRRSIPRARCSRSRRPSSMTAARWSA